MTEFAIDATRSLPSVLGNFPDRQCLGLPGSDKASLKPLDAAKVLVQFCLRNAHLRLPDEFHDQLPVNGMPVSWSA
jgi:hypothetical protein